jgi:serine protease Do
MQATRRATIIGLGLVPAALLAPDAQALPESFAPLIRRVASTVVGVTVRQYEGVRPPRPVLPRRAVPETRRLPNAGPVQRGQAAPDPEPPSGSEPELEAAGSGFIIGASGLIVTNNHVVGDARVIMVTLADGRKLPAEIVGTDQLTDLAVVRVNAGHALSPARWGNSATLRVGDWILAAGNPFDLGPSFTAGIVSARGRELGDGPFDRFLQLDAPMNPGNSGGPAFNMDGDVVGVDTAILSPSGGSVGVGFAIPSNMAAPVVAALIRYGAIPRGWLGVAVDNLPAGVPGVAITGVEAESPAAQADLEPGDIVRAVNNLPVDDASALIRAIASVPPGTVEHLTVMRKQQVFTLPVVVGRRPAELGSE